MTLFSRQMICHNANALRDDAHSVSIPDNLLSHYPRECHMKIRSLMVALLAGAVLTAPAFAQNSQQNKMTACNAQAAGKKGDDRKAFMKDCLSAKPAMDKKMTQQEKMKACNASAAGKKGDDRKAFMKDCLSAH
jgi:hypothetical protein